MNALLTHSSLRQTRNKDQRMDLIASNAADHRQLAGEVPAAIAQQLLASIVAIAQEHPDLAERRRAVLSVLAQLVQADAGWRAWGRGWPDSSAVAPVAIIDFGFTDQQRAIVIEWALDADT